MNLNLIRLPVLALCSLLITACGLFGDKKQPMYYDVPVAVPLEIPDGLDTPSSGVALTIEHPVLPLPSAEMSAVPPRVVLNQSDDGGNTKLRWSSEGIYILVEDSTDSVQRRLEFVIERSGMELLGQSQNGEYRFNYDHVRADANDGFLSKLAFWRDDSPDYSGSYQILSRSDGDKTRVYLLFADGGEVPVEAAEHVLAILKGRLG